MGKSTTKVNINFWVVTVIVTSAIFLFSSSILNSIGKKNSRLTEDIFRLGNSYIISVASYPKLDKISVVNNDEWVKFIETISYCKENEPKGKYSYSYLIQLDNGKDTLIFSIVNSRNNIAYIEYEDNFYYFNLSSFNYLLKSHTK
jgi:hypothetical protein